MGCVHTISFGDLARKEWRRRRRAVRIIIVFGHSTSVERLPGSATHRRRTLDRRSVDADGIGSVDAAMFGRDDGLFLVILGRVEGGHGIRPGHARRRRSAVFGHDFLALFDSRSCFLGECGHSLDHGGVGVSESAC